VSRDDPPTTRNKKPNAMEVAVQGVTALFASDLEGRLELLGCTTAPDVAAGVAEHLLAEHPARSPDRDLDELIHSRRRALAKAALGGNR